MSARASHGMGGMRGMTLMEASISVGLVGVALAVVMQMLVTTSTNMDIEMNESNMATRTSGRMYDLGPELEAASTTDIRIFAGTNGAPGPAANWIVPHSEASPPLPISGIGDTIAFHILNYYQPPTVTISSTSTGTGTAVSTAAGTGLQKVVNPVTGFPVVVCYHWAPMNRGGVVDPNLGMLVKDIYDDPAGNWWNGSNPPAPTRTIVVEENITPRNFLLNPNGTLQQAYPTGFAVFQGDVEVPTGTLSSTGTSVTRSAVSHPRMVTVCIQRAQSSIALEKLNMFTATNTDITTGSALSQTVQTFFLKTP